MANHGTHQDVWVNRLVVLALSQIALCSIIGSIVLEGMDKPITPGLIAIASAALGFLGGLLIPRPRIHNGDDRTNLADPMSPMTHTGRSPTPPYPPC